MPCSNLVLCYSLMTSYLESCLIVCCRLRELLRSRLKECGWRDKLKDQCRSETILTV